MRPEGWDIPDAISSRRWLQRTKIKYLCWAKSRTRTSTSLDFANFTYRAVATKGLVLVGLELAVRAFVALILPSQSGKATRKAHKAGTNTFATVGTCRTKVTRVIDTFHLRHLCLFDTGNAGGRGEGWDITQDSGEQ